MKSVTSWRVASGSGWEQQMEELARPEQGILLKEEE